MKAARLNMKNVKLPMWFSSRIEVDKNRGPAEWRINEFAHVVSDANATWKSQSHSPAEAEAATHAQRLAPT